MGLSSREFAGLAGFRLRPSYGTSPVIATAEPVHPADKRPCQP